MEGWMDKNLKTNETPIGLSCILLHVPLTNVSQLNDKHYSYSKGGYI